MDGGICLRFQINDLVGVPLVFGVFTENGLVVVVAVSGIADGNRESVTTAFAINSIGSCSI